MDTTTDVIQKMNGIKKPEKEVVKKMMIILSKATLENVYAAFILANGARSEELKQNCFLHSSALRSSTKRSSNTYM
jgi:peroxiredoxin family protein